MILPDGRAGRELRSGCPKKAVTEDAWFWLSLYGHYKNGLLWKGGGLSEQPYVYLQAMQLIDGEIGRIEAERHAEDARAAAMAAKARTATRTDRL